MTAIFTGVVLDYYGPRICAIIGSVLFALGHIGFAYASSDLDLWIPSFALIAIGGPFFFMATLHLSAAFPRKSGLILASLTGAFDASSFVYFALGRVVVWSNGRVGVTDFFQFYTLVPVLALIYACVLMPSESFRFNTADDDYVDDALLSAGSSDYQHDSVIPRIDVTRETAEFPLRDMPLTRQIYSLGFGLLVVFMCVYMLRLNFYIETIGMQLVRMATSDPDGT
jgi:MFS family permease